MGFCTDDEYKEFLRSCPLFEEMLIRSGIILVKYWFSVNDEEQELRFQQRMRNPVKRWKLSKMDIESRRHWVDYSKAKDHMFAATDTKASPWYVVNADSKKRGGCIAHLLSQVPYKDLRPVETDLPPRQSDPGYQRPKMTSQRFAAQYLLRNEMSSIRGPTVKRASLKTSHTAMLGKSRCREARTPSCLIYVGRR